MKDLQMHKRMYIDEPDPEAGTGGHRSQGRRTPRTPNPGEDRWAPDVEWPKEGGRS
jgi:hypothetical protein